ncbi:MAG: CoA transferase [Archaeoglobaceae archaeon]|nr:CoA transferase [Archaeoglobaceae archaeon]MDW8128362.1 CaiB/BaiF CoA-transferase family protein [Archaeoglobaceae archaeon]
MLDITVLEVASYYPAPFCARILASLGAKVIKIETPAGEPTRAFEEIFAVFNLGKDILRVDLKTEEGKKKFFELVERADVIVEGLRPGVTKKLGIDYESTSKVNPGIIYCSITAFGQRTKLARFPAHDLNVLGLVGILEICGKGEIYDPNIQFSDLTASLMAVIAILSALIERERTGLGKRIDISMLRSSIFSLPVHVTSILNSSALLSVLIRNPAYGIYRTKDGYITLGIVAEEHFWRRLCEILELKFDFGLTSAIENFERVREELAKKIGSFTTKEIIEKLRFADVPAFEVFSLKEIEKVEELLGEKLVEEVNFGGKRFKLVKPPW